ncbi:unnamed protein product [Nippostrongylus brasiliensis]|uniref:Zinc metalloproteinase n=1 Tax=Nippostrongylus brasiliensis TaxID=27835 RepID=A0A158R2C4_NIPBR|nr:unnamed protein product [Nippostrongylus brasiliensis]
MRVFVILFHFCVILSASSLDKPKFKEEAKKFFNAEVSETLAEFRAELEGIKDKIKAKLILTEEKRAEAEENLKQVNRTNVDEVQADGDSIDDINEKAGVREVLYQGDIVLTREQSKKILEEIRGDSRSKRQAYRDAKYPSTTWMNRIVSYFFDSTATPSMKSVFKKAAELWEKDTCLDIVENESASDSIRVFYGEGCWSYVGRIGGVQNLSLGKGCNSTRAAAHELGHALGFSHTQSRHDRDSYITVFLENIRENWLNEFVLETKEMNDNYNLPYDYGSLMHYGCTSGSKNKKEKLLTMLPTDLAYTDTLGSPFISFIDLLMMNKHYNCTEDCPTDKSAKCENQGFPHPRDCLKCICPGGYGGPLCNQRPEGCGTTLNATENAVEWVASVGNESAGEVLREDFDICYYWIQAPKGKKVRAKLLSFTPEKIAVDGCKYGGVEFKWHRDQRRTGSRYCSSQGSYTELTSTSNIMPIIMYNSYFWSTARLQFYYVDN